MRRWNIRLGLGLAPIPLLIVLLMAGPRSVLGFPEFLWRQDTPILFLLAMTGGMNLIAAALAILLSSDTHAQFLPAVLNALGALSLVAVPVVLGITY